MARSQHRQTITLPAGRGTIFDSTGVQMAIGEQTTTVYADPRQLRNARAVSVAAQQLLGVDANELYPQLLQRSKRFVYVKRFADPAQAAKLAKRGYAGLGFYSEEKRTYPQRTVGAQVVGFAGVDNKGLTGVEVQEDGALAGKPGKQTIIRDPFGRAIDIISSTAEREGRDVYLTLDHTIQAQAEQVLRSTVAKWHARAASAVVLDPSTGAVLAMAQAPGYDANDASRVPLALQRNRAITDTYEPGSTYKLVTVTGALADGLVTPSTRFTLPYSIAVADRVVHDAEQRPTETMSVAQILSRSSNVGAITLAQKLGSARLMHWIEHFGFGKPTGIDFPGESGGLVLPLDKWSGSTIGNVPIGPGHRGDADPDGLRLRGRRERRRVGRAAPRRPRRRHGPPARRAAAADPAGRERAGEDDARRRRARGRHRHRRRDPRLHRCRQDRHRREAGAERLHDGQVRRLVRRHGAGDEAAPRRARHGRRAARADLRRRGRGAGLCGHREVRAAVPRGAARRAADRVRRVSRSAGNPRR
jgi:hypothetical protein